MSGFKEIEQLSRIARPNEAVVTNIGDAHLEQLGSRAGIAEAKMEIAAGLQAGGHVFVDGDEPLLAPFYEKDGVKTVGFQASSQLQIKELDSSPEGFTFRFLESEYTLSLLGEHNVKNVAYAIAVANGLGLAPERIAQGLKQADLTEMRLQKIKGTKGELIINDAINANPTSMLAAIKTVKALPGYRKRVVVLGDMYELGRDEERLHRLIADEISEPLTAVITVGKKRSLDF